MNKSLEVCVFSKISDIDPQEWDCCANAGISDKNHPPYSVDPFVSWRFLHALEASHSVGEGTGWLPQHLVAYEGKKIVGVAPMYVKLHSYGEYVFDHAWADAYERAGGRYYPKLQIASPFTPVTGRRLLVRSGEDPEIAQALIKAAQELSQCYGASSLHITFCSQEERRLSESSDLLLREGVQFHWENRNYESFDEFLANLSSRKRKAIRRERRIASNFGGEIFQLRGNDIRPEHWDAFWEFYQDTGARKWGQPYLTRSFFDFLHKDMREDILLIFAIREGRAIAGALNFVGKQALFGRYWGAIEHHDSLHFEICYYQAIEFAIKEHLSRVEAGAQGEHKLARGYLPVPTYSLHWFVEPRFSHAVAEYLSAERQANSEQVEILTSFGPFRRDLMQAESE